MPLYFKILLVLVLGLYIINPYDLLPDFFPFVGWLDDAALLGIFLYFLRKGRLPAFLLRQGYKTFSSKKYTEDIKNGNRAKSPYEILDVKPGASHEEIRKAYHLKAQAYHPDKVAHLGPELKEMAQKKFVAIQKAYDELSK